MAADTDELWLVEAKSKLERMPQRAKEYREKALSSLWFYANLVNKGYMYGSVHKEIYDWMEDYTLFGTGEELTSNKLIMLPRAHLKSHMVATWCSWVILRNPEVTILYVSATAELAITQLYAIKNILSGSICQRYFPEYIHPQEGKREKWTNFKISIDHPKRKSEGIRDATVSTAGLTTNTTGWHADIVVSDDLVVPENAYSAEGRDSVAKKASQFTSIRNAGGFTMACGTRYHPSDIYYTWKEQIYDQYSDDGDIIDKHPVWEVKEYVVERDGLFIWPRVVREDGKAFGFDYNVLARIKAEYVDQVQYYSQYYNDPNDPSFDRINRSSFQYYNPRLLKKEGNNWLYNGKKLNVYAAVDFAFSLSKASDYSAIVVVGVDSDGDIYVLDIDRFKTQKILTYFKHISELHSKWIFRKLRAEVSVAQEVIVESIKDHIKKDGSRLSVDSYRPNRHEGSKAERIAAALDHRYDNLQMYHFEGGLTPVLEEELIKARPLHDDVKDALACAVSICVKPARSTADHIKEFFGTSQPRSRFGGVAYR